MHVPGTAGGSPRPWNWWIDRWNFTATVSRTMNGTSHEQWAQRIGIWEQPSGGAGPGEIVGLVLTEGEGRGEAFIQSGPDELPGPVIEEMFDFIEERFPEAQTEAGAGADVKAVHLRIDPRFQGRRQAALRRGFTRESWSEPQSWLEAGRAPEPGLPPGYQLADGSGIPVADKALLHARSFGYVDRGPSLLAASRSAFQRLTLAPDYRPELDLVAMDERGEPASMAGFWYDGLNGWGVLEPLGTAREHCRRGLARALIGEGMVRLCAMARQDGGAFQGLWVGSEQPFYLAAGFEVKNRWEIWKKS